jgi:glycosyltransferase involved in cell wall biosynthesis
MSCELPVAASNVGGLPEIISDQVGGLFESANPEALAAKVVALLSSGSLRALGAEGRRRVVANWSNGRLADRHLEIYEQVIARRQAHLRERA